MGDTLFKEVGYSLRKIIEDIDLGEIGLPDIQRPFVWDNTKVRDLFDSMYRGFPIGYLLFWANGLPGEHRQIGSNTKQKVSRLLIVDGQQRLTSLYAVLKGIPVLREGYEKERINIAFCPRDTRFEVADAAIKRDAEYIPDISRLWSTETSRNRFVKEFLKKLRDHREVPTKEEDEICERIDRLYDLQNYPFTVLELSSTVDEEQVAEVFVRVNSMGKVLNQADFILTLMSVFWDEGRAQLEHFCADSRRPSSGKASPYNQYIEPDPDQLLRVSVALAFRRAQLRHVYSILRGKDLETGVFSDERQDRQFALLKDAQAVVLDLQNWHEYFKVLLRSGYRSGDLITSKTALFYGYAFFLIGKRDFKMEAFVLRNLIARWFFMTALTGRYTSSPESVMEEDLARLRGVKSGAAFAGLLDKIVDDELTKDFWAIALPNMLVGSAARNPAFFAFYAALNLLDAKVLLSKVKVAELLDPASKANKAAIERHHLFPRAYLESIGVSEMREINQIGNFAVVEWSDNVDISDEAPAKYFPKYARRFDEKELEKMYYWHALPKGWEKMEYSAFLEARRRLIAKVVHDGYSKLQG